MRDPFQVDGPTCISFSGGRTSAYMLWRVLQSNGGLPPDARVIFANTGKEAEETLQFVRDCSDRWGVHITWVEYRIGSGFAVVDFESASRNGEPFDQIIKQRGYILPNPRSPYCSSELKSRSMHRYLRSIGFESWESFVGIRADEPIRVGRFRANPHPESPNEEICLPLADAGVTRYDVSEFWAEQSFDLGLQNYNGNTAEGNCDLCFRKHPDRIKSLVALKPSRAAWWIEKEAQADKFATGDGNRFRNDRPSYAQYAKFAEQQTDAFGHANAEQEAIACFCGD